MGRWPGKPVGAKASPGTPSPAKAVEQYDRWKTSGTIFKISIIIYLFFCARGVGFTGRFVSSGALSPSSTWQRQSHASERRSG